MGQAQPAPSAAKASARSAASKDNVGDIYATWKKLTAYPGGKRLFSFLLARKVPYTGTIGAQVIHLEPGHVRIELRDRRKVRNHLRSVHAIAMANLGEFCSGLAMMSVLPKGWRGILRGIDVRYVKKARGVLVGESKVDLGKLSGSTDLQVIGEIRDAEGDVVATVTADWRVGPPR